MLQDWIQAYKQLSNILADIAEVKHIDLWHEQIDFTAEEYPWPSGSVFLDFDLSDIETNGLKTQNINAVIDVYYALDTLADSYKDSTTQDIALSFGGTLKKIQQALHGVGGADFGVLNRRNGPKRISAPQYLIVYKQTFTCIIRDQSAMTEYQDRTVKKVTVQNPAPSEPQSTAPLFKVPTP